MQVKVTITAASKSALVRKVNQYMNDYHPTGYGTWIDKQPEWDDKLEVWIAVLKRFDSCE